MTEKKKLADFYQDLAQWLTDVKKHEVTQVVELIEHAKTIMKAAEEIPEEKFKQFIENFKYDLHEFYQQNQEQAKHSIYLGLMKESFWAVMANITDKSQVEWAELCEDFHHDGVYQTNDVIGFGLLECQNCHQTQQITHFSKVNNCLHCGHNLFLRKSLTP
ncbi:hypothetical protein [Thalassotalea sp. SU-HH00458]|uniref:zinc ribbon-containing protein n=1 Tax=Thalassotalea sp. SU-HH00458 TaxID=3127657 RepID=UPI003108C884